MKKVSLGNVMGIFTLIAFAAILTAFTAPQNQKKGAKWDFPAKYQTMKNPYVGNKMDTKMGKMFFDKFCKSCHGSKGLGNGARAAQLNTFPGDFSSAQFQSYSDGELFYIITVGRGEMESYSKKITDQENIWGVINYLRTLKK